MRDDSGSVLVESAIAVPFVILLMLGAVDMTYLFVDWTLANKAAYVDETKEGADRAFNKVAPTKVHKDHS